jgi:hypothetical protein
MLRGLAMFYRLSVIMMLYISLFAADSELYGHERLPEPNLWQQADWLKTIGVAVPPGIITKPLAALKNAQLQMDTHRLAVFVALVVHPDKAKAQYLTQRTLEWADHLLDEGFSKMSQVLSEDDAHMMCSAETSLIILCRLMRNSVQTWPEYKIKIVKSGSGYTYSSTHSHGSKPPMDLLAISPVESVDKAITHFHGHSVNLITSLYLLKTKSIGLQLDYTALEDAWQELFGAEVL